MVNIFQDDFFGQKEAVSLKDLNDIEQLTKE